MFDVRYQYNRAARLDDKLYVNYTGLAGKVVVVFEKLTLPPPSPLSRNPRVIVAAAPVVPSCRLIGQYKAIRIKNPLGRLCSGENKLIVQYQLYYASGVFAFTYIYTHVLRQQYNSVSVAQRGDKLFLTVWRNCSSIMCARLSNIYICMYVFSAEPSSSWSSSVRPRYCRAREGWALYAQGSV